MIALLSAVSCNQGHDSKVNGHWEWTLDTIVYDGPPSAPTQVIVQSIWGSSAHDVWAVAGSDDVLGELWHYDGIKWKVVTEWPYSGIDLHGSFINDLFAVTGFDSTHVFLFGHHGYDTTEFDLVLMWNGRSFDQIPWQGGTAPRGGLSWGVKQNDDKLWAVSSVGQVVKYLGATLSVDTVFQGIRLIGPVIAALDNGDVYLNIYYDSLAADSSFAGVSTTLYRRNSLGVWSQEEHRVIGSPEDNGVGIGTGIYSFGNHLFTVNNGLWEKVNGSWIRRISIFGGLGGTCFTAEDDLWIYFSRNMWHFDGSQWSGISISFLPKYTGYYLYGQGWSEGTEIFIGFNSGYGIGSILHGRLQRPKLGY